MLTYADAVETGDDYAYLVELSVIDHDGKPSFGGDLGHFADPHSALAAAGSVLGKPLADLGGENGWEGRGLSMAPVDPALRVVSYRVARYTVEDGTDEHWTMPEPSREAAVLGVEVRDHLTGATLNRTVAVLDGEYVTGALADMAETFTSMVLTPDAAEDYLDFGEVPGDEIPAATRAAVAHWIAAGRDGSTLVWPSGVVLAPTAYLTMAHP